MQVSRAWHDSFSESAFKSVRIRSGSTSKDLVPPIEWMQKYGRFIHELGLSSTISLQHLVATANPKGEQELELHQNDRKQTIVLLLNLKRLELDAPCTLIEVKDWLLHCPRLDTLILRSTTILPATTTNHGEAIMAKERGVHLLQHYPRLTRLDIDIVGSNGLPVDDLAEIISHLPPSLTEFSLRADCVPRPWFEALSGFLERMTVLDLYGVMEVEGWMFKRIVCSCPLLVELRWRIFTVDELFSEEDASGAAVGSATTTTEAATTTLSSAGKEGARMGPWACTGLQTLVIFWITWSDSSIQNRAATEHLGLLKDLERLTIDVMTLGLVFICDTSWPTKSCNLSAEDLRTVPQVRWMHKTWPLLKHFELCWKRE